MFYLIAVLTGLTIAFAVAGYVHIKWADREGRMISSGAPFLWVLLPIAITIGGLCMARTESTFVHALAADDPSMSQHVHGSVVALDASRGMVLLDTGARYPFMVAPPRIGDTVEVVCNTSLSWCKDPFTPTEWSVRKHHVSWRHWLGALVALGVTLTGYALMVSRPYRRLNGRRLVDHR